MNSLQSRAKALRKDPTMAEKRLWGLIRKKQLNGYKFRRQAPVAGFSVVLDPENIVVGSLNEDFALESLPGDIFSLGTHCWKIIGIDGLKVRVLDANGQKPSVQPIHYSGSRKKALARLKAILQSFDRVEIITGTDDYLYATFTSKFFKFVDDVEFYVPKDEKVIHIRSASRTGKYDFGVNKKRVSEIVKTFENGK